ncbi:MAG: DUF4465 domain-containing protein [Paludibacteraceae bacterium]|nr:DUF4465 domain-containing protein [Paludibacteraceae bacterium]
MKKSLFFVAALALTFAACTPNYDVEDKTVATFEEAAISPASPESALTFTTDTSAFLQSGIYQVQQTVAYGGTYVTGGVVTNITSTDFKDYTDAYKSAAGGAHAGKNYVVWYADGFTPNVIKLTTAGTVPGMYVCNNVYALNSMKNGDDYAGAPFAKDDWFKLTIGGSLNGAAVDATVDFYLAQGTDIVTEWTYVDLSKLGKVDELNFTLTGSRTGDWGLNTPTYFCIDDLGAKK